MKETKSVKKILGMIEVQNITKTSDFAKKLNITPAAAHGHIKKMRKNRVIKKCYMVNYSSLELIPVLFMLEFFHPSDREFIKKMNEYGQVKRVVRVGGDFDCIVLAVFDNDRQIRNFMTAILSHSDKIRNFKTVMLGRNEYI
jgi:DNA-binding Lrp family transcriptional regulator